MAKMLEELLDVSDYELVQPFVRLFEQEDAKRLMAAGEEQTQMNIMQPTGINADDTEEPLLQPGE